MMRPRRRAGHLRWTVSSWRPGRRWRRGPASSRAEEIGDERRGTLGLVEKQQVAGAVDKLEASVRNPSGEDAGVACRNDGVTVAGQHEGWRVDAAQPRQAGPSGAGDELARIAPEAGGPGPTGLDLRSEQILLAGDGGPVQDARGEAQEGR